MLCSTVQAGSRVGLLVLLLIWMTSSQQGLRALHCKGAMLTMVSKA